MFVSTLITKELQGDSFLDKFQCLECHRKAQPTDYMLIKVGVNLNNVGIKVELLEKCKYCYKFKKEKGALSYNELYVKLLDSILL